MNCKDKLAEDHPEWNEGQLAYHIYNDCPSDFEYHSEPKCGELDGNCTECWDSEVEENEMIYAHVGGEVVGEVESIDMTDDSLTVYTKPVIKDSGNRREFESGAVRDMQEGKGRCDLMPLEVVAAWLKDDILGCIAQFKINGTTTFLYGALNYFLDASGWSYYDALLEVAKHFEDGAKKYGENNWQKGIPPKCYIDSAVRHYLKWLRCDKDEPHDRAFVWNLMCCIWEVDYHTKATVEEEKECI